jgi:hypothetical protein
MPNDLQAAIPKILSAGLVALRQATTLPSLVSRDYDDEAAEKGDTITLHDAEDIEVQDVAPGNTPPATQDTDEKKSTIKLDHWKEASFYLTDKDVAEAVEGVIPERVEKASIALAEQVNADIAATYSKVYSAVGTAGQTPFGSDYTEASAARKALNNEGAPMSMRRMVVDPDAEENAINLSEFADASFAADDSVIVEGQIGRKLGFDWAMDQQLSTHNVGNFDGTIVTDGAQPEGTERVTIDGATADQTILTEGDLISFAGVTGTYAVQAAVEAAPGDTTSTAHTVILGRGLEAPVADDATVTQEVSTDHVSNLAFHRDAFALAIRPLADVVGDEAMVQTMVDPLTGIPLRLEITREHKRTRWSFDLLYGTECIQPELATRVLG